MVPVVLAAIGLLSVAGCGLFGSTTPTSCPNAVVWSDADRYVGKRTTVRGQVVGVHYATAGEGQPTFLDVGRAYPDPQRFTIVIWGRDRDNFPTAPEQAYRGHVVCVTGFLDTAMGSPGIEVASPTSIAVQ